MTEYSNYYENTLYPIQNEVLKSLKNLNLPFYLTGGTAVSRGYFHHRYSDDLDLFINNDLQFSKNVELALKGLEEAGFKINVSSSSSPTFTRIFINQNINGLGKNGLKVDFVNDIDLHFGDIQNTEVYYRTDSIRNILSNKYTALYRLQIKDVVDILEISKHYSFDWKEIIKEANEKEAGIDLKEVVTIFSSYTDEQLLKTKWVKTPDIKVLRNEIIKVTEDMMLMKNNSLHSEHVEEKTEIYKKNKKHKSYDDDWER